MDADSQSARCCHKRRTKNRYLRLALASCAGTVLASTFQQSNGSLSFSLPSDLAKLKKTTAKQQTFASGIRLPNRVRNRAQSTPTARAAAGSIVMAVGREAWRQFILSPIAYMTIPVVAALVGYGTNWVGVKMIFYPINFWGVTIKRWPEQPLGLIGWQGIVPCKTNKMSRRLVDIITTKLLSLKEAFSRLDATTLADLLEPSVASAIEKDARWGEAWIGILRPNLRPVLIDLVKEMQRDIDSILDLREVVSSAFMRDKVLLGELFQKAGRKELEFLVNSGLSFGFLLGIFQMILWICAPNSWTLPVGGALVGYITNWVAIKLIFDPVEPTKVGPFVFQGLFEKRQVEVSSEFSEFLAERVLTSQRLLNEISTGRFRGRYQALVRKAVPGFVPDEVTQAAASALTKLSLEPRTHPLHVYVDKALGLQPTLNERLCKLSAAEFENLLHPVFAEDELTLIFAGGVLGAAAGALQMIFGWGGPSASGAIAVALSASAGAGSGIVATKAAMLLPPGAAGFIGRMLVRSLRTVHSITMLPITAVRLMSKRQRRGIFRSSSR